MTLPCQIDPNNPDRFEIDFDAIPDWQDAARRNAAQVAARRASGSSNVGGVAGGGMSRAGHGAAVTVIGSGSPAETAEAVRRAEEALGMDLDGDGDIG